MQFYLHTLARDKQVQYSLAVSLYNLLVVRVQISMQEAHYSMWSPIFPTYVQMVTAGGISVYLKRLCEVRVGQDYLLGDGSLCVVKCLLID